MEWPRSLIPNPSEPAPPMRRLKAIARLLNLTCEDVAALASQELDRELSRGERIALSLHVVYCRACRRYRLQVLLLRDALARLASSADGVGPTLPPEARERIKRALREG